MKNNYGIDAPIVVRNLFLLAFLFFIATFFSFFISNILLFRILFLYFFSFTLTFFLTVCWMVYGSKITKPKIADQLIKKLCLQGNERVLDIGCGRGLFLCEVAKYLLNGQVEGIDLWSKDQSNNRLEATLSNVLNLNQSTKVTLHTGAAQNLPFQDAVFDVVISSLCFHNIKCKNERSQALSELVRVLKPQGRFVIIDIQKCTEYVAFLLSLGIKVNASKPNFAYCPPLTIIEG